ncbi:MAG: FapA family protein [Lachnospiraceae bacterium]|nr:FapA family protein [Lachnospiraceae bacterium]
MGFAVKLWELWSVDMDNIDSNTKQQELHFPMMENDEYQKAQNQEIKLGKEEGLDVSIYANPQFNWLQMEQIRMGLKDKLDASIYADPSNNYETMRQIRLSLYSGTNLIPYLKRGFADDDLGEIRLALLDKLPIDEWLQDNMCAPQIHEIRIGLCEGLDVSAYADLGYNWMQMQEIRLGLEKKLDVKLYANRLFNHAQMREIRLGLEAGLDVSSYCTLLYSATDMKEKRQSVINRKRASGTFSEESSASKADSAAEIIKDHNTVNTDNNNTDKVSVTNKKSIADSYRKKEFVISIEENGNKAYAYIPWIPGNVVTKEDIYQDLERREIVYGIKNDAIADLIDRKRLNEKVLIAEGIPAKKGEDGWFEWFVRLDLPRIPAPLPDGGVDYVNIEAFEMVDEGEKIAVYHRAEEGVSGKNIYGETIHAENGIEKKPLRGIGFTIDPDGVTYRSKMNGKFEFTGGRIIISNMLIVREDVTAVTGKLEVDGSVYVIGSIFSGGYIKATGDIIIEHNVETGKLIAGGNVMIKKGSCSKNDCFIEAGGEVSGSFFEAANINAGGNVKANYIMNSNINTMGRVIVSGSKGVLLGGKISAVKGVDTFNLGNRLHLKTVLDIGRNELYEKAQTEYVERREQLLSDLEALEKEWNKITLMYSAGKEVPEEMQRKIYAAIDVQKQKLAELDGEASKLVNLTEQTTKDPVCIRGRAYEGSTIIINGIKYALTAEVRRVIFKLRNKQVVMVAL